MKRNWRREILLFLQDRGWVSPTSIGKALQPSNMYGSPWASPKCKKMVAEGLLDRDERGRYRARRVEDVRRIVEVPE